MHDIEHDDEAITAKLRGYVADIRELDDASRELDRRRRDVYREAREYGFSTDAIKRIARQRHDGEAQSAANDLLIYVEMLGGERATDQMRKGKTFSEVAFGDCGFPSDFADALGDAESPLIVGWSEKDETRNFPMSDLSETDCDVLMPHPASRSGAG
jgi:uncharacterized protein (UPF0335 family)